MGRCLHHGGLVEVRCKIVAIRFLSKRTQQRDALRSDELPLETVKLDRLVLVVRDYPM